MRSMTEGRYAQAPERTPPALRATSPKGEVKEWSTHGFHRRKFPMKAKPNA